MNRKLRDDHAAAFAERLEYPGYFYMDALMAREKKMEKDNAAFGVLAFMTLDGHQHLQAGRRTLDFMERMKGAEYLADVKEEVAEFNRIEAALAALLEKLNRRAPEKLAELRQRRAHEHA